MTESEKERIARLETKIVHLSEIIERLSDKVDTLSSKFSEARGAWFALVAVGSIAGFFGSKIGAWFWQKLP